MSTRQNFVWVDIPAVDLDRAIRFYSEVLGVEVERQTEDGVAMGVLPHTEDIVGGSIYLHPTHVPTQSGPLLYFNVNGRLSEATSKVEQNAGKMLEPVHQIGQYGWRSVVQDSEGNRIALHSESQS